MIAVLAAAAIAPFFLETTSEVRSAYQTLGKIVEDRPMQVTNIRVGCGAGAFGRLGIRNLDVSSLTDRRHDVHRHALYSTGFGPMWQYDFAVAGGWRLKGELTRSWTLHRGYENRSSDRTYHWYQLDQSVENPYLVPFCRARKCFRGNDYFYFKSGVRRKFVLANDLYVTPSVFAEGGSSRNQKRVFGDKRGGGNWRRGVSSVSVRLEFGWRISECVSMFAFVEQYEVAGGDGRRTTRASSYCCAHNDWTHGGIGIRMKF